MRQSETAAEPSTRHFFEPRRNRKPSLNRATSRGRAGDQTAYGKPCRHSRVSKEHRDCATRTVRTSSTSPIEMDSHDTTVGCSIAWNHVENTSRRKQEDTLMDFLVTGPEPDVERFLAKARDKLNMQDAVRLYKAGDESRLLATNLRQLENGYSLQGKPLHIHGIATAFGTENAQKQASHQEPSTRKHRTATMKYSYQMKHEPSKTCVGKAMYLSHHRSDIQHSVNTLSRSMRNPSMIALRRLKKLTRHLLGQE